MFDGLQSSLLDVRRLHTGLKQKIGSPLSPVVLSMSVRDI